MVIQQTVTVLLPDDADLRATLDAFLTVKQALAEPCFNSGKPLGALALQRACYHAVKGRVKSQMTITAIRSVAAAYAISKRNGRPAQRPFAFRRKHALFLIGSPGRDAAFRPDGTLSIWTVAGRKRIPYRVPDAFRERLSDAKEIDSLNLIEHDGQLIGRVTITREVPEPTGEHPVGIDLNETNALVAVDADNRVLFISGRDLKVANKRTRKKRKRLQRKLAAHKAQGKDTHSVRRSLKRLGRKQRNRTRTFAQTAARQLVDWTPENAVLVFEDLDIPQPSKKATPGKALRRRLTEWQRSLILHFATARAQERGIPVAFVDPAFTSQICSCCGRIGHRHRHRFACACGFAEHADINAAVNVRDRYTALRCGGHPSVCPEALVKTEGKPPT
jgi:putative transposase